MKHLLRRLLVLALALAAALLGPRQPKWGSHTTAGPEY